jgi:hypothetical protein
MSEEAIDHGTRRFAVLHHTGSGESHYDFLFEKDDSSPLITFRLPQWPVIENEQVKRLKDHRRVYLEFEGAIPGDRGRVDRVAEGTVQVIELRSAWVLRRCDGQSMLRFENSIDDEWWVIVT